MRDMVNFGAKIQIHNETFLDYFSNTVTSVNDVRNGQYDESSFCPLYQVCIRDNVNNDV